MKKRDKVAAIIPARWASTRFPGKPLHLIAGKPLIRHVWERCTEATAIDRIIIATDDKRIARAGAAFGAEVCMTSPRHTSGTDRVAEVALRLTNFSHIINVQGDEPLISPPLIDRLATALLVDPALEMVTAANVTSGLKEAASPHSVKVVLDRSGNALYFSRSPVPCYRDGGARARYYRHQGIYGYSRKFLLRFVKWKPGILEQAEHLEQLRALENGARIRVLITESVSIGVDTPEDIRQVSKQLKRT